MQKFDAGSFAKLSQTPTGRKIWEFLQEPKSIKQMKAATARKRPAVEGIQDELLARFGDEVRADRIKQMIGLMVLQIMKHQGYDKKGVKISSKNPFSSGTLYEKRPNPNHKNG